MGKKTPLYDIHKAHKEQIIEFGGWDMPVSYTGVLIEHRTVRENVGNRYSTIPCKIGKGETYDATCQTGWTVRERKRV